MTRRIIAAAAIGMLVAPAMTQSPVRDGAPWLVEAIRGRGVIDNAQKTLRIAPDNAAAAGSTGCNVFHDKATMAGERRTAKVTFPWGVLLFSPGRGRGC